MSTISVGAALAAHGGTPTAVCLGLVGVVLARIVFVDRENRKLGRHQTLRETLPLTMVAMLITGVIVWDNDLGFSKAAFTGLGVGWTAIVLLDVIGRRIVDPGAIGEPEKPHRKRRADADSLDGIGEALRSLDTPPNP